MGPLHWELAGEPGARPLVLAHGFTQTARLWGEFGVRLGRTRQLVLVDLPGHGRSASVRADLTGGAALLLEAAGRALGGDRFDLLGYSLGARFVLHAALAAPASLGRIVTIGVTGGLEDPMAASARRAHDEERAEELESTGDLAAFLRRWLSAPMFAGLAASAADLGERMRNTPEGLASSLRLAGTGTQEPLWARVRRLDAPALLLAGADDPRFVAAAGRLAAVMPCAAFTVVPGARHAAHLHQAALTARIVTAWLDGTET